MYVDDIADMRALRPWVALSVTMERRAIRLGKLFAGELFIHRERVRHAAALLQVIAAEYFRERPSLDSRFGVGGQRVGGNGTLRGCRRRGFRGIRGGREE